MEDSGLTFDITATDNAGNSVTLTASEIDDVLLSIDTDVPAGLTFESHTGATMTSVTPILT